MTVRLDIRGRDDYGHFTCSTKKVCGACGREGELTLRYSEVQHVYAALRAGDVPLTRTSADSALEDLLQHELRQGVNVEHTILARCYRASPQGAGYIGITCGCYAKFHRQVAHIVDSMKERGTLPQDA